MASPPDGYEQRRRESAPVVSWMLMEDDSYTHSFIHSCVESTSTRERNKCLFLPVHLHGMCNLHVDMCYDRPCVTVGKYYRNKIQGSSEMLCMPISRT